MAQTSPDCTKCITRVEQSRIPCMTAKISRCLLLPLLILLTHCAAPMKQAPLTTVPHVDLPRYAGDWYVFAHIPYSLEKGKVGTLDRYVLRPDGKMDNIFLFRRGSLSAPLEQWKGVAWVHNHETNAEWRVQFIWPFRLPYLIIDLDPDYQWSVVGYPNRKLAWVLSRKPVLDEATYQAILKRMAAQGYNPAHLAKVPQVTEPAKGSR
jgi:apolipoprotein D and lipocalin family protein